MAADDYGMISFQRRDVVVILATKAQGPTLQSPGGWGEVVCVCGGVANECPLWTEVGESSPFLPT